MTVTNYPRLKAAAPTVEGMNMGGRPFRHTVVVLCALALALLLAPGAASASTPAATPADSTSPIASTADTPSPTASSADTTYSSRATNEGPVASSAGTPYGSRAMKEGMRGHDISVLQKYLTKLGFTTARDSVFGKATKHSVKRLEKRQDWKVDGRVSRKQAKKIKRLVARVPKSAGGGSRFYFYGTTAPTVTVSGGGTVNVVDSAGSIVMTLDASSGSASWYGRMSDGRPAPDGDYSFADGSAQVTGGQTAPFELRNHIFPVRGDHDYGGAASRFGAPRSGHTHQGQDVAASCGTPLVAAQGGTVMARSYEAGGAGNYVVIKGKGSRKDYVYMHMIGPGPLTDGQKVRTGQRIGKVGSTGSSTGCHLHFERWTKPGWYTGGHPYDPLKSLKYWDSYS
jgi:murein DD-endopeptidase MepM/ murein hydrolase activator NlpD